MSTQRFQQYMEAEVLGSDPVKLTHMLYRGAVQAVGAARRSLASGNIRERSRQITKAWDIVQELAQTLDHAQGGEFSRNLAELYPYIQQRLLDSNARQSDEPLAEAEKLLTTLSEAWDGVKAPTPSTADAGKSYEPVSWQA
jgi:flagellar protein FliS